METPTPLNDVEVREVRKRPRDADARSPSALDKLSRADPEDSPTAKKMRITAEGDVEIPVLVVNGGRAAENAAGKSRREQQFDEDEVHEEDEEEESESNSEEDEAFNALPEREKFLRWIQEEKEDGSTAEDLFTALGMEESIPLLLPTLRENLWRFWELLSEEEKPLEDLIEELHMTLHGRKKLAHINSHEDAIKEIQKAKNIIVISGAGISVSCGVPDFRSPGGLYDQISAKFSLPDPQMLFDINVFRSNPLPFFEFSKQLFPDDSITPSVSHKLIKALEDKGKLLRHYTQNIDTLERAAGITKSIQCHGSFAQATCMKCQFKVEGGMLRPLIMEGKLPYCTQCNDNESLFKPDIVFFGEALPDDFKRKIHEDCQNCDLLIVMGSSLRVAPVANIPRHIAELNPEIPQLLLNNQLVFEPHEWDHFYEGLCDESASKIMAALGWQ